MSGDDTSSRYKYSWFRPAGCILFEMEAKFELPDLLRQYVVSNVRQTGRELGKGAYGSVVEVEIPGAVCAAKKVHETLTRLSSEAELRRLARKFVEECQLMSSLRHPHVVQFLGVCFFPGSWLPFLLMERMLTSLSQLLETNPTIPLAIKRSILCDVARGLLYLHSQTPPIAHRDLTAKNILLNSTMVAKIADLGVARILNIDPGQLSSSMTQAPGATVYMSPEALEPNPRYNTSLDIFSFGNVAMYTLTQEFPQLKAPTFLDSRGRIKGRTEIERRVDHIQQIYQQLGKQHPLAQLTVQCLHNDPRQRPPVEKVLLKLEELKEHIPDVYGHMTSMEMMKLLAEKGGENQILRKQLEQTRKDFVSRIHFCGPSIISHVAVSLTIIIKFIVSWVIPHALLHPHGNCIIIFKMWRLSNGKHNKPILWLHHFTKQQHQEFLNIARQNVLIHVQIDTEKQLLWPYSGIPYTELCSY